MSSVKSKRPVRNTPPPAVDETTGAELGLPTPPDSDLNATQQSRQVRTSEPRYSALDWNILVSRIKDGEEAGMEQLYKLFSPGIRYYLSRQLGPQDLEDRVHDTFVIVVNAIRRGELREPKRLMGFVRNVVRRQVAAHIQQALHDRKEPSELETGIAVADRKPNPEQEAIVRQNADLMKSALSALSGRDREILIRFYLKEQSQEQICSEMSLTEARFRLLRLRAKARFGEIAKRRLSSSGIVSVVVNAPDETESRSSSTQTAEPDPRVSSLIEDPIVRALMTTSAAFQSVETGRSWLATPNPGLGNVAPIMMISTELGREKVINELGLIEHGMF